MPNILEGSVKPVAGRFAIVVARFNESITRNLLKGAVETLAAQGVGDGDIDVAWVPGAFEIPTMAARMAASERYLAVLCLGAVIRGETTHDQYINAAVSTALAGLGVRYGLPVLFGVLTCNTLEQAVARSGQAKGELDVAQSQLENAKLNLEFTQVTTPINGRVSRNLVDVGNLVGAVEKTQLTTVVNDENIYCYFNLNERDLLLLKRIHQDEATPRLKDKKIPITLALADEKDFPHKGIFDFADVKLNPETGTVQSRAVFENPDGFLLAGMFARLRIPYQKRKVILVPNSAIQFDQAGKYVLVLNDKNEVQPPRRIVAGRDENGMTIVEEGLTTSDRVISTGTLRARPGITVRVLPSANETQAPPTKPVQEKK